VPPRGRGPRDFKDEVMVILSVSEVLLPYTSVISIVKVVQVAPTATGVAGWVTQRSLFFSAVATIIAELAIETVPSVKVMIFEPAVFKVNPVPEKVWVPLSRPVPLVKV